MHASELTLGRTFGLVFDHGEDFFPVLEEFCRTRGIRQGFIPSFVAGFKTVDMVGTCDQLENPDAPIWSKVHLRNVEAFGGGTVAFHSDTFSPHIHISAGLKEHGATGHTSHLLHAQVQFLVEMLLIEVISPEMRRTPETGLYDVPLLRIKPDNSV